MRYFICLIALLFFASCAPSVNSTQTLALPNSNALIDLTRNFKGQIVYVPIYSHIYHENQDRPFNLAATLSIRNTDMNRSLAITSVKYYDTEGRLIKDYLNTAVNLKALGSKDFVVERRDTAGGSGANFIVEWSSPEAVTEPVIEAVMVSASPGSGVSFLSVGRTLKSY